MMYPPDEVHTSFITDHANYYYRVMPFGLKNAGTTYQRLMDKVFHQQIGRNMEVYVDDMVVKTTSATDHVVVKTDYPIKQILRKPELAGRMIAWSVELSEFGIQYETRGPLKAQCLADFVAELMPTSVEEPQVWTLHVDGSSNSKGGGAGIILEGPNQVTLEQSLKFGFKVTNNQAEYEALLARLRLARDLEARKVSCNSDSKLMVEQLSGTYQAKDTLLQWYFHTASHQISSFDEFTIKHVPREQNARVDLLSKLASTKRPGQHRTIIQETLHSPSLGDKVVNVSDNENLGWMAGIWGYLKEGTLPEDKDEARKIRMRSAKFIIIGDEEIHQGICGMHSGARSMATRVLQAGYYWPTLKSDCQSHIQKCKECQQFGNAHRQPPETLHHMISAWPFSQWGMDILGPFPAAKGQLKFLLVAIDYFTKWIETCPLTKITTENVRKFTWKNIVCRLTYGADAMIPVEVGETSHRRQVFNNEQNARELTPDLDLVDELRDEAQIHEEAYKLRASQRYNTKVKPRSFRVGDLVWRLLGEARKDTPEGKLAPTWGGPFRVIEDLGNGAYRLEELSEKPIPRTWNATHLKFYFS
uniref:Gypsy retrotransposon integrase-like protein 1 n=1 Tax=Cajanus cajan TaxID=3821 RepID=A0A151QP24_CAJCA|nr:Gypsy retrotransposon integrase-like protein 1 [Cajanus cajan]